MTDVLREAAEWLAIDPDETTRAELEALVARATPTDDGPGDPDARDELRDRFAGRLRFGTAGLRGELGAGPNRMNRVVVVQTTAGLARFLLDRAERARRPHVVVGYDGRRDSDVFAVDTAEVLAGAGIEATLLPTALPTPVLAFAVRLLGASAGVMITASHNPPGDNGYKLYLGDADGGSQLVSPDDRAVLAEIDRVVDGTPFAAIPRSDAYRTAGDEVVAAYVRATVAAVPVADGPDPRWVYTPMHGVGLDVMQRVVAAAGVTAPVVVPEQAAPDGRFPTVAFPNPEEPGALDLAFQTAYDASADLIIANDPDADRLAVAVHDRHGAWEALSGNEVGLLLAWSAARRAVAEGRRGTLAASLVSSPGLRAVADHFGLGHRETPTGFKHISRAPDLVFGFEEALGYLVDPEVVRDKDGISAALMLLGMWRSLAADGRDLESLRAEVDRAIGCFASAQVSVRVDRLERIRQGMAALRADPPTDIGGIRVAAFDDLQAPDGDLPPTDALRFWLEQGARVIVRPSGTEPKLKLYIDVVARTGDVAERRRDARRILTVLQLAAEELVSGV